MVLESDILKCVFLCQVTSNQLIPFMQVIMKKELKQLVRGEMLLEYRTVRMSSLLLPQVKNVLVRNQVILHTI